MRARGMRPRKRDVRVRVRVRTWADPLTHLGNTQQRRLTSERAEIYCLASVRAARRIMRHRARPSTVVPQPRRHLRLAVPMRCAVRHALVREHARVQRARAARARRPPASGSRGHRAAPGRALGARARCDTAGTCSPSRRSEGRARTIDRRSTDEPEIAPSDETRLPIGVRMVGRPAAARPRKRWPRRARGNWWRAARRGTPTRVHTRKTTSADPETQRE